MALLAIDLGGTKLALGIFTTEGILQHDYRVSLDGRNGEEVGKLITDEILKMSRSSIYAGQIQAIGICVPGISRKHSGTVWAPNIPGWDDYPLLNEIQTALPDIPVTIESDRACYIMGEVWKGNAIGAKDAVFLAVGTGIGLGILCDGNVVRGANDISGAIGWMALQRPFQDGYKQCGCFEYHASGSGIARAAQTYVTANPAYEGELKNNGRITSHSVFAAAEKKDDVAMQIIDNCIQLWGMAVANIVSFLNPEKIIFGGGVFGPAATYITRIRNEAEKWAQPVSMKLVTLETSLLGVNAGVYGAGLMALQLINGKTNRRS
jgi:glucokinase